METRQRLEYLKRLKPSKLAAMCPVKPTLPPAPFDWSRRWTTVYPHDCKGMTIAQFLNVDAHAPAFSKEGGITRFHKFFDNGGPVDDPLKYVAAFERCKGLKPCTAWVKVAASYG